MPGMFMGKNRPALKKVSDGRYEGKGVITRCPSGNKDLAELKSSSNTTGKLTVADFVFEVK